MKISALLAVLGLASVAQLSAQWRDETYALKGGWNAIYIHGDATYEDISSLFASGAAINIEEVWRWNPNPTAVQYTDAPTIATPGTPEWSVWKRFDSGASTLSRLTGRHGYLVKCAGTASNNYSVTIRQRPLVPQIQWVREGANLLGFQTPTSSPPTFSSFFQTFPSAIATGSDIFKYTGGDLGSSNPIKVFSPVSEPVQRNQAYWFESDVVSDFQGQVKVECSSADGLSFGDEGSLVRVTLRNRGNTEAQITLENIASATDPTGARTIDGTVPLKLREYDYNTLSWDYVPFNAPTVRHVTAKSSLDLFFVVDRTAFVAGDFFASLLKMRDQSGKMEVYLPVSAERGNPEGLWLGDVTLGAVSSPHDTGSPGSATQTATPMRLRMLIHVSEGGTARLLSQAYVGLLDGPGVPGICTVESLLDSDSLENASRFVSAHLPLDQVITGTGDFAIGNSLQCVVTIPFDDATNPFVHQYHPDHDNLDARFEPLGASVESPDIRRTCQFNFTATPPGGGSLPLGWGATVMGGTYTEILGGVHKQDITLSGTFEFRRVSNIGTLTTP